MKVHQYLLLLLLISLLGGCQPKVYLMPSPVGLEPEGELFSLTDNSIDENLLYTLYVTNRNPFESSNRSGSYTIFPSGKMRFGFTVHRVGEEGVDWDELFTQSIESERNKKLLISSEYIREVASIDIGQKNADISSQATGYFDQINKILDNSFDKNILLYVHGANCNFYRATAQGAQFFHFTGHNTIVMTFSWPSAENILRYSTDVAHAQKSVPAFATLIETLADRTNANSINILAYSAGAQVVAPGLAYLRNKYPDLPAQKLKAQLRLGDIYFAAPDSPYKSFVEQYMSFKEIVQRTTINLNKEDSVLELSEFQNGVSRLGRPDDSELSEEEVNILIEEMKTPKLNVINVGSSEPLELGGAHDSWYSHPWVSMDVLMLMLFDLEPFERGLEEQWTEEVVKMYVFPYDYETRIYEVAERNKHLLKRD